MYGLQSVPVKLESEWSHGEVLVPTYQLDELLATKLRALYQSKKGRDLFDLWCALTREEINVDKVIEAFNYYMHEEGNRVTPKEFLENMEKKITDADFIGDMNGLLRSGIKYDIAEAYGLVREEILQKI